MIYIGKDDLRKAAEEMYEDLNVEYVEDKDNGHWDISVPDPDEIDEDFTIAKLYDDFSLEIVDGITPFKPPFILDLTEYSNENIYQMDPKKLLEDIVDIISSCTIELIEFLECINDSLK